MCTSFDSLFLPHSPLSPLMIVLLTRSIQWASLLPWIPVLPWAMTLLELSVLKSSKSHWYFDICVHFSSVLNFFPSHYSTLSLSFFPSSPSLPFSLQSLLLSSLHIHVYMYVAILPLSSTPPSSPGQGATVKAVKNGKIVISRVLHRGAADKSGEWMYM